MKALHLALLSICTLCVSAALSTARPSAPIDDGGGQTLPCDTRLAFTVPIGGQTLSNGPFASKEAAKNTMSLWFTMGEFLLEAFWPEFDCEECPPKYSVFSCNPHAFTDFDLYDVEIREGADGWYIDYIFDDSHPPIEAGCFKCFIVGGE